MIIKIVYTGLINWHLAKWVGGRDSSKDYVMKRPNRLLFLASIGAAALVALSPAAHAQATGGTVMFSNDLGLANSFTTGFSDSGLVNPFTETLTFTTATAGTVSINVSTTTTGPENDTDFTNVFLTGTGLVGNILIPQVLGDPFETRGLAGFAIGAGTFTLNLLGTPGTQNGSFGGSVAFQSTSAVPEAGTWAMMLLGFGASKNQPRYLILH